jgi:hypothetical protein
MDSRPGQYSTASLRPRFFTSGHPAKRQRICLLYYRGKLPTSYTVYQPERHSETTLGLWRATKGATSWQLATGRNSKPGFSWATAAVEQIAHRDLVGLPVQIIQREAAHEFVDGVRDWEMKQHLIVSGGRSLNEALTQAPEAQGG